MSAPENEPARPAASTPPPGHTPCLPAPARPAVLMGRGQFYMGVALSAMFACVLGVLATLTITGAWKAETAAPDPSVLAAGRVNPKDALSAGEVYRRAAPGTVFVQTTARGAQGATGSGFVLDARDGLIVTNEHVVHDASAVRVTFQNKTVRDARVLGTDPGTDLALLKLRGYRDLKLHALTLADSRTVTVGDPVLAIGAPFGLDRTLTTGVLSATGRTITAPNGFPIADVLQTDAAINPGNSGGPLLDGAGRVIGINSQISSGTGSSAGVGFSIASNTLHSALGRLRAGGAVRRAWMGVSGVSVAGLPSGARAGARSGVLVQDVTAAGPAARAGIRAGTRTLRSDRGDVRAGGDIIVALDGRAVREFEDVVRTLGTMRPGRRVRVRLRRGARTLTVTVTLGTQPAPKRSPAQR